MDAENFSPGEFHPLGESGTRPIGARWNALTALLVLAGTKSVASSRLSRAPHDGPLVRGQLPFLG
jgi:hypothetical protein